MVRECIIEIVGVGVIEDEWQRVCKRVSKKVIEDVLES